ncbi:DUF3892 domain-containing protein [Phenylobacterium sp.]|uniref:DUF3892 domain-containing protein n=1 Tax=Phenylobacterium sp. TaxID=1871053 RepID=UPI003BAD7305
MARYEVTHATPDGPDYGRRIDMIGGPDFGGWRMRTEDAIHLIKMGFTSFYVRALNNPFAAQNALRFGSTVEVVVRPGGLLSGEYLTTIADGIETNNLRSLPPCPLIHRLVTSLP